YGPQLWTRYAPRLSGGSLGGVFLDQSLNDFGRLGAVIQPVLDAILGQAQVFLAILADRIVEAKALDEAAIATIARVGCNDIVERTFLRATAGQTNHHHR